MILAQPANLKKLARERMARTGESYTTARKNILTDKPEGPRAARAAAARNYAQEAKDARYAEKHGKPKPKPKPAPAPSPAEELPEYPAPTEVVQYDAGLWHRVLTQAGVSNPATGEPLSEALLAGLAGGIGFMAFTFEYEQATTVTLVTRAHPEPYTQNLLRRCGAKVTERTTGSSDSATEYLDAGLDAGRAVVVRVAVSALPWIEAGEVDEADTIDVAIVGEHEDDLLIDDGSGALMPISPNDLAVARAKRKKEKNWQAWIPSRRSPNLDTLSANVLEAVTETNGRLLGTLELKGIPEHFANRVGIAGMHTWVESLRDTDSKKGWTQIFADPQRLETGLAQLHCFMTDTRFGGLGGLRGLYADFLDECEQFPGLEPLAEHAADYAQLAADWIDLSEMVDPEIDPETRSELFARMADQMEKIAAAEERAATALASTLSRLKASKTER